MFGQGFNYGFLGKPPCFTDTTDIFKDNSGVALYTLDYDGSDAGGASGKFGEAAIFNGSSSYVEILDSNYDVRGNFSLSLWFKLNGLSSNQTLFAKILNTSEKPLTIRVLTDGRLLVEQEGNNSNYNRFSTNTVSVGNWYNLVWTADASFNGELFINNVSFLTTNPGTVNINNGVPSLIGIMGAPGSVYNGSDPFNGSIDQVRIFSKGLSSSEVATLYNETKNTTNTLQILGDTSCIATYPFDGSSTDLSGNYNGTDTNIIYRYDGTPTDVDFGVGGKSNYGAGFNGSSSKIVVSDSSENLNFSNHTGTISAWVNLDSISGGEEPVVNKRDTGNPGNRSYIFNVVNGVVNWYTFNTDSNSQQVSSTSSLSASQWHHIVVTLDQTNIKIYIDGVLDKTASSTYTSIQDDGADFTIGYRGKNSGGAYFDGDIDQVRLFNKALSAAEISKLYGNGAGEIACKYTPTTDNIAFPIANTAYYKLDNNSKDSAKSRGKFNQGATFVGNSAGIVNTTLQLSSTAHSVSLWMKPQDLTATKWQIMFFSAFNGYPSFTLGKRPDQTTSFHYRNESSNEVYFTLSNANTWYHVVVTRNNSGSTVYVNGSSVATDSNSMGTYPSSAYQKASIGSNPNYPAEYFDGTLDQIRVYDVALTSTDVANLYNSETTSTTNTLAFPTGKTAIATYTLDGNGVDVSGNYSGSEGDNIVYAYDGTGTNIEYRFGRFGQAAVFNGSDSKIDTGAALVSNQSAFTFSVWVNFDNLSTQNMIILNSESSGNGQLGMYGWTDGNIYFQPDSTASSNRGSLSTSGLMTTNQWVHIVMVFDGSATGNSNRLKAYIQGVEESLTYSGTIPSSTGTVTNNTYIGGRGSQSHSFHGEIDQVRIFSTALTSSQVTELYNEKPETDTSNFKTVLFEANASTNFISNVGMDLETNGGLVWLKSRDNAYNHGLFDSVRGTNNLLQSNTTAANNSSVTNNLNSFEKTGFFLGANENSNNLNNTSSVAWCWKGGGDAVSNTDGTITSQVSANTEAGFSIVSYTGNGANATVGHGLDSAPELIITKGLTTTYNWNVSSSLIPNGYLQLNTTDGLTSVSTRYVVSGATTNSLTNYVQFNQNNIEHIAYCFHSVAGYSKISTYTGATSGVTVNIGFAPSFVLIKSTTQSNYWGIFDNKRPSGTGNRSYVYPNTSDDEDVYSGSLSGVTLTSTGFAIDNTNSHMVNKNGETFLYMAFK